MTSRHTLSTAAASAPARTAATPASWLAATTSTMRASVGDAGSPTQSVRVMSEQ